MTLRTTTFGIVIGSLVTFLVAILLLFRFTVFRTFSQLEAEVSSRNTQHMQALANAELGEVLLMARYWAARHADAPPPLSPATGTDTADFSRYGLSFASNRISVAALIDPAGHIVFAQTFDISGLTWTDRIVQYLPNLKSIPTNDNRRLLAAGGAGVTTLGGRDTLLAALCPVRDRSNALSGWLFIARDLSQSESRTYASQNSFALTTQLSRPFHHPANRPGDQAGTRPTHEELNFTGPTRYDTISGQILFKDLLSGETIYMRIDMPRSLFATGVMQSAFLSITLITMSLVFILITIGLLNRHVLSRLSRSIRHLRASLQALAMDLDPEATLAIPSHDEFGLLANAINDLLLALRKANATTREREKQLAQAEKLAALGTLVSGVAHELNTPNNYINLNAEMLERILERLRSILDEIAEENGDFQVGHQPYSQARLKMMEMVDAIRIGGKAIQRIVMDLKVMAQQESPPVPEPVSINDVIQGAIKMMQSQIDEATDRFDLCLDSSAPLIRGDRQKLEQMIANLLQNACHALRTRQEGIVIESRFRSDQQRVEIAVRDEGIGIPAALLDRIREPFFTTKRDSKGTGLGLFVTSTIVDLHHGMLRVESVEGTGTTVTVSFPALSHQTQNEHKEDSNAPPP